MFEPFVWGFSGTGWKVSTDPSKRSGQHGRNNWRTLWVHILNTSLKCRCYFYLWSSPLPTIDYYIIYLIYFEHTIYCWPMTMNIRLIIAGHSIFLWPATTFLTNNYYHGPYGLGWIYINAGQYYENIKFSCIVTKTLQIISNNTTHQFQKVWIILWPMIPRWHISDM